MSVDPRKPGRWYVVQESLGVRAVVAEVADWSFAEYLAGGNRVAISRMEALADPAIAEAVREWEAKDDSAVQEWTTRGLELIEEEERAGIGLLETHRAEREARKAQLRTIDPA